MANEKGVWRTIGGRRVFIKEGQDLASAMKESGKFKSAKKFSKREELKKDIAHQVTEAEKVGNTAHAEIGKRELERLNNEEKEQAVKDYENGKISAEDVLNKFYGQEDKMKEAFEKMGYTAPTKENIDRANANARQRAEERKNATKGTDASSQEKVFEDFKNSDGSKENFEKALNKISEMEYNNEINPDEYKDYISKIQKEYVEKNRKANSDREASKTSNKEQFSVSDLKKKAQATLPKEDIDTHEGDLYLKKTKESTELLNNMKDKDSGLLTTFKDQETGETWYDIPFANMGDDYKEKTTNDIMNEKIRSRGKSKVEEDDLPKRTEIKTQGTSNRKEVSDNIQAHILDYYTEDYTGENISPSEAFVRQMDAMGESNMWRAGQKIAEGGSYLIYNGDMADFLDELKINPKGKTFSEDKAFDMYTSLIGRESAKLYDRIQKNSYKKYMKAHPLSKMSFEEFKDMNKK